jgi:hypothetical protein
VFFFVRTLEFWMQLLSCVFLVFVGAEFDFVWTGVFDRGRAFSIGTRLFFAGGWIVDVFSLIGKVETEGFVKPASAVFARQLLGFQGSLFGEWSQWRGSGSS